MTKKMDWNLNFSDIRGQFQLGLDLKIRTSTLEIVLGAHLLIHQVPCMKEKTQNRVCFLSSRHRAVIGSIQQHDLRVSKK